MPPPYVRLHQREKPPPIEIPHRDMFESAFKVKRDSSLILANKRIDEYLPGLKIRIAKWLLSASSLEFDEVTPTNLLGESYIQSITSGRIKNVIKQWLLPKDYQVIHVWVSSHRIFIKIASQYEEIDPIQNIRNLPDYRQKKSRHKGKDKVVVTDVVDLCDGAEEEQEEPSEQSEQSGKLYPPSTYPPSTYPPSTYPPGPKRVKVPSRPRINDDTTPLLQPSLNTNSEQYSNYKRWFCFP